MITVPGPDGLAVEICPMSSCFHCGVVPHRLCDDGSLTCLPCLQRPTAFSLPREVRNGE